MRSLNALAVAATLALPAAALAQQTAPATPPPAPPGTTQPGSEVWDRVVATVGDTTLLYSDVMMELESMQAQGQQVPTDPAGRQQLVQSVIGRRVDDLLLLEAARRDKSIVVDPADIATEVETQINRVQQQFGGEPQMEQALRQSGRTVDEYRRELTRQYTDQTMIQRYVSERLQKMASPAVSEAEIQQYFEQQKATLGQRPATLSFQQVLVKPAPTDSADAAARHKAEDILAQLRKGADFATLAKQYSADPSSQQGGMLGWFRQGQMVREFEQMAFALAPGEISPVVKTEYGYHIIKLEKVRGPERQARHILIRPEITDADVARARARADSIAAAVRGGASIADAAARTGTPPEQRNLKDVLPDRLPPEYAAALATATPGTLVGPVQISDPTGPAFAVLRLNDRRAGGEYTLADVHDQVRDRIVQQKQVDRLVAELRQVTAVSIKP